MNIINLTKVCNAYQTQTWPDDLEIPEGNAAVADGVDFTDFYAYNGFVTLTIESVEGVDTVTAYTPDVEAWEAWKATLPEPEPDPEPEPTDAEKIAALEAQVAEQQKLINILAGGA